MILFIAISLNICFRFYGDRSVKYPQHMIWLKNEKINLQLYTLLLSRGLLHIILMGIIWSDHKTKVQKQA